MAISLIKAPVFKITLMCDEVLEEMYPGYIVENFKLTKRLLEPNRLDFTLCRETQKIELSDYDFELKDDLLAAKVEVKLNGRRYNIDKEEWEEYENENFFYGYVQNIKVVRESNTSPYRLRCTAFSPDSRLKGHPSCNVFYGGNLKDCVEDIIGLNATESSPAYDSSTGEYGNTAEGLMAEIEPVNAGDLESIPYTVQYNESAYNFLKRLAVRYGEFLYYEDRQLVFGDMVNPDGTGSFKVMHLGTDLENYTYELNMNDHSGVVYGEHHPNLNKSFSVGYEKSESHNDSDEVYSSIMKENEYENGMAYSAFDWAQNYYGNFVNSVRELGSTPMTDVENEPEFKLWDHGHKSYLNDDYTNIYTYAGDMRRRLDEYVISDSLLCYGKSARGDLKLGDNIIIEEETRTAEGDSPGDWIEHKSLRVIDLTFSWPYVDENNKKHQMSMDNTFKAMPADQIVPPYLERDKDGFLVYGEIDAFPKCGPQYGVVVDNEDPDHMGRVQVCLAWQEMIGRCAEGDSYDPKEDDRYRTPWIWVLNPYQGGRHGMMMIPEIGDQVLVGFEHNNAERPYVIGSRFTQDDYLTKYDWKERSPKNNIKAIRTRGGHTVEIVDNDKGDGGMIHIYDRNTYNYDIYFDTDTKKITLESAGNIELVAKGNIVMKANGNIQMNAEKDIVSVAKNDMTLNAHHELECASKKEAVFVSVEDDVLIKAKKQLDLYGADDTSCVFLRKEQAAMGFGKQDDAVCSKDGCETKASVVLNNKGAQIAADKAGSVVAINSKKANVKITAKTGVEIEATTLKSNTKGETAMKGTPGHYD